MAIPKAFKNKGWSRVTTGDILILPASAATYNSVDYMLHIADAFMSMIGINMTVDFHMKSNLLKQLHIPGHSS